MKRVAFVFPGQGSQFRGMGKNLYEQYEAARLVFEEASDAIGVDMKKLCFDGSMEELTDSKNCQPSILTVSVAAYKVFEQEMGFIPYCAAGHSLGEYSALTCSGAISLGDAVKIVRQRGIFMQEDTGMGIGTMSAVKGIDRSIVQEECNGVSRQGHIVCVSGYNSPEQTTISGHVQAVDEASERLKKLGAEVVSLKVGNAFHSPLMEDASAKLRAELSKYTYNRIQWTVVSNVTGLPYGSADEIIDNLVMQMVKPVNWLGTVRYMWNNGVSMSIELGPKTVLKNLMKRNKKEIDSYSFDVESDIEKIKTELAVNENRSRVITKCMAIAVATRNKNWDNQEYEEGVIKPYKKIQAMQEMLEKEGREPSIEEMEEALRMLISVFNTKKTPSQEQKERFDELYNETGVKDIYAKIKLSNGSYSI